MPDDPSGPGNGAGTDAPAPDWPRTALVALVGVYGVYLLRNYGRYSFLDSIDLAIHEAGHILFGPLGEFMMFLGGTLAQLLVPAAFVVYFVLQGNRWAASVVLFWVAQNLWNVSVYIRDTRAQVLPLVGGGEHDWLYLLTTFHATRFDHEIANVVQGAGTLLFVASVVLGLYYAGWRLPAGRAE